MLVSLKGRAITLGISIDTSSVVLVGCPNPWGAVDTDIENPTSSEGWERRLNGAGFGDSLCRDLGLRVWVFLQDGLEGCFGTSANL